MMYIKSTGSIIPMHLFAGGGGPLGLAEFSSEKGLDRAAMFAHDIEMIMDTSNSQGKGTPPRASLQVVEVDYKLRYSDVYFCTHAHEQSLSCCVLLHVNTAFDLFLRLAVAYTKSSSSLTNLLIYSTFAE